MGPYNEMKQLERKANVRAILQRNDLSAWARNFWGVVFDTIATSEHRYNSRVESNQIIDDMNKDVDLG
jgi:hypothetical protein|tara:strand:- start:307 stop:510 length:204 start_codon:yes stop_codon:yes gene_type:complete